MDIGRLQLIALRSVGTGFSGGPGNGGSNEDDAVSGQLMPFVARNKLANEKAGSQDQSAAETSSDAA